MSRTEPRHNLAKHKKQCKGCGKTFYSVLARAEFCQPLCNARYNTKKKREAATNETERTPA